VNIGAMVGTLVAALLSGVAFALWRREQQGGAPSSSTSAPDPLGGLWGMLNEGADSNPFLPAPSTPAPSPYVKAVASNAPRGIRNRNPGNVKRSSSNWLGKVPFSQSTDPTFEQFVEPKYGLRVIAYLLLKYQRDKGKRTVRALISEPGGWAPSNTDKNPAAYSTFVANAIGVPETAFIDLFARDALLAGMVKAIVQFENGQQPYGSSVINEAIALAREAFS
jgi:hypothetical protein